MNTGMMWFDNDPKSSLDQKISKAAEYYQHKYGRAANMCIVNPVSLGKEMARTGGLLTEVGTIKVDCMAAIMPNNLWIGVQEPGL